MHLQIEWPLFFLFLAVGTLAYFLSVRSHRNLWRPIATAPRDGTKIIAVDSEYGDVEVVRWHDGMWSYADDEYTLNGATHWKPLGDLPK